ncbi:uncharacterized protein KRP23_13874 [Phytophthora ramorum]|uniref:uncharacterized protein n=1 Tax=Phytophthora ramorum TaxID=164328 RepID=UPI0030AB42A7|nr:hypothetical protein KRP23_13874 [Phytophthora ramorum]
MPETRSSPVACLVVTTSGRILLLWDQDDTLPFRYPQLAMLLASLFHYAQAQSFGHLELQNGFTVLVSSHVEAQISVGVICATPPASGRNHGEFSAEVAPLQLGRFKSLLILQEFVRCYRGDIERLAVESVAHARLMAEEYTLTSALGGFQDDCEGTLDEFVAFQSDFVTPVMETTARGLLNSIMSWSHDSAVFLMQNSSAIRVARGFLMNAETGDVVFSTQPASDADFFGQDPVSRRLHHLHKSARVQQLINRVAKALHESAPVLIQATQDNNSASATVIVRFTHLSGNDLTELYVALRVLPTGVFSSGIVFYGDNELFRGRQSELLSSGKLHQALAAHPSGKRMLNVLQDPSVDIELHVGSDGAPEEVWRAMAMLVQPLTVTWPASTTAAVKPHCAGTHFHDEPIDSKPYSKLSTPSRLPQHTE